MQESPTVFQRTTRTVEVGAYFGGIPRGLWARKINSRYATPVVGRAQPCQNHSYCFMVSSSLEKELREIIVSMQLKCKATCCRNYSSMRTIRTDLLLSR